MDIIVEISASNYIQVGKSFTFVLHLYPFFVQNRLNINQSRQMDIIFEISASNYIGWQKFHLCSPSLSIFDQNPLNIKESRQMDIIFEISASNYTGWQKFHPKRTKPTQFFNNFLSRYSGPIGVKTELGPPRGGSLRSPRALRARREKKTQHGQCERCAR